MQITYRDRRLELQGNITGRDAIKKIGLDPESVLVIVNGKLVTDDVVLREKDEVKLVAVVSGGSEQAEGSMQRAVDCLPTAYSHLGVSE